MDHFIFTESEINTQFNQIDTVLKQKVQHLENISINYNNKIHYIINKNIKFKNNKKQR